MNCPICGHKMEPNDAFCSNCGNFSLPLKEDRRTVPVVNTPPGTPTEGSALVDPPAPPKDQEPQKAPKKVAERLYPPQEAAAPKEGPAPQKPNKSLKVVAIIACLVAAAATAVAVYVMLNTSALRVQLNKAQQESSSAQASLTSLENQVSSLTGDLDTAKTDKQSLSDQIAALETQIADLETTVNQSQYDKDAAQRDLESVQEQLTEAQATQEELQTQLTQAQEDLESAQAENESLTEENESLTAKVSAYESEVSFYNSYVVFVMLNDSDKYYHKYSCSNFTGRNFLAYSTKLAEANGYSPCPVCIGGSG